MMLLTLAAGCAPASTAGPSPTSVLGRIRTKGELVVGTAASMPPLNMTTKTGEIIGLEIDLAQAMADAMRVKLRLATMPFVDLLPALEAGQVDMILSGMSMTPERNMKFAFVGPYLTSGKSFLAKETTVASSKGSEDLNTPTMRLAAELAAGAGNDGRSRTHDGTLVQGHRLAPATALTRGASALTSSGPGSWRWRRGRTPRRTGRLELRSRRSRRSRGRPP